MVTHEEGTQTRNGVWGRIILQGSALRALCAPCQKRFYGGKKGENKSSPFLYILMLAMVGCNIKTTRIKSKDKDINVKIYVEIKKDSTFVKNNTKKD